MSIAASVLISQDGRMTVVTRATPITADVYYVGMNSFGFGGTNAHLCLRSPPTRTTLPPTIRVSDEHECDTPLLLCYSARTEQGMNVVFDMAEQHCRRDPYLYTMLSQQCNQSTTLCPYRGHVIVPAVGSAVRKITV